MPRGNPNIPPGPGRPKGAKNKCTIAKDEYFTVYFQMGGKKLLKKELNESKRSRSKFLLDTLPALMPKKTAVEVSGVEGGAIEFTNTEIAVKIAYILDKAIKKMKEAEQEKIEEK